MEGSAQAAWLVGFSKGSFKVPSVTASLHPHSGKVWGVSPSGGHPSPHGGQTDSGV